MLPAVLEQGLLDLGQWPDGADLLNQVFHALPDAVAAEFEIPAEEG